MGHKGGGGWKGGWGAGYPPYGWGFPGVWQAPATEIFVVDDSDKERRTMAYVMSLPKNQRKAAYEQLMGKPAPAGLSGVGQTRAADTLALGGIFDKPSVGERYPFPGSPEVLDRGGQTGMGGCSCPPGSSCGGAGCGLGGIVDTIAGLPTVVKVAAAAAGVYLLWTRSRYKRNPGRRRRSKRRPRSTGGEWYAVYYDRGGRRAKSYEGPFATRRAAQKAGRSEAKKYGIAPSRYRVRASKPW